MLTLPNAGDQHESCVLIVFAPRIKLTVLSKTCMQRCAREEDCNSFGEDKFQLCAISYVILWSLSCVNLTFLDHKIFWLWPHHEFLCARYFCSLFSCGFSSQFDRPHQLSRFSRRLPGTFKFYLLEALFVFFFLRLRRFKLISLFVRLSTIRGLRTVYDHHDLTFYLN